MSKPNIECMNCGKQFYKKPFKIKEQNIHTCCMRCYGEYVHNRKVKEIECKFNKEIKTLLTELYIYEKMTTRQISKYIGLSYGKVCEWLKKYDVPIRYGSEAIKIQWIDNDERRKATAERALKNLNSKESRDRLREIMQTEEYKLKQSKSKMGSKNGMWRVCGEKHPNWDSKRTHEKRYEERKTTKDHIWRSTIFKRDNRKCCKCNEDKGKGMIVHHINSYDIHEKQRYDINNGVVMCEYCHKQFHHRYGYGKNTKEQFEEYLKTK